MAAKPPVPLSLAYRLILADQGSYIWTAILFGVVISALTLAVPVAVQLLIDSVANLGDVQPVIILSFVLFLVLAASGSLVAAQNYVLEMFERRFFARTAQDVTLRTAYAETMDFEGRNREDLYNRFFEIESIKSHVPTLISSGLSLILQAVVGYVVVSFYHPYFLLVSALHAAIVIAIWQSVDRAAVRSVLEMSTAKFRMGNWLESMAVKHRAFKSEAGVHWAIERSDDLTQNYIDAHKRHFACTFTQTVSYQVLMALGSALLLGIGGLLVVRGQLTVGQLVAAELILGTILINMGGFSTVLESWYGLRASLDKLAQLHLVPLEDLDTQGRDEAWEPSIQLEEAQVRFRRHDYRLDAEFPAGSTTLVAPENASVTEVFCNLLLRVQSPAPGRVLLGGRDIEVFDIQHLRDEVTVVSDTRLFECTVAEYMRIGNPSLTGGQIREFLDLVGLDALIDSLDDGVNTVLTPQGHPLTTSEILRLKIAQALALRPRILVFTVACDLMRLERRQRILNYIRTQPEMTFVYLSNRLDLPGFERYLRLGSNYTEAFSSLDELVDAERSATRLTLGESES
ncbi:MAG: ABC transporter transmembrane domain-containing protein [Pseudomonadales bacterium]|jgi:putative ABC transport system ATP-binding protein|nr:ABC transporter transmembrane domain-containing protein [Pseudomonadales bacterium]